MRLPLVRSAAGVPALVRVVPALPANAAPANAAPANAAPTNAAATRPTVLSGVSVTYLRE